MRNRYLGRDSAHRRALFSNLLGSLIIHESIETTLAKAKDLRIIAEKIISIAKRNELDRSSLVKKYLHHDEARKKVTNELTHRYAERPGGYTRIVKTHFRTGDTAPMAIIMLVGSHGEDATEKPILDSSITNVEPMDSISTKSKEDRHTDSSKTKKTVKNKTDKS